MKALINKFKSWKDKKEAYEYEEWKRTQSKSTIKRGLFLSFAWASAFTLLKVWEKYDRNLLYSFDEFKNDALLALIISLFGGIFVIWFINKKYRAKLLEEKSSQN